MAHETPADKRSVDSHLLLCSAFLNALYPAGCAHLWLEMRCIHPSDGRVKQLWIPGAKLAQLKPVLLEARRLNAEGYNIYFAPCLRSQRRGTAWSAVLMPALWAELDRPTGAVDDTDLLARLRAFPMQPSALLATGGGVHAYWLFSDPIHLEDNPGRVRAGQWLKGLSAAVGGDPHYVKSVATPMRLPGFANTKPGRGGAQVQLIAFAPEQRYDPASFAWLRPAPQPRPARPVNQRSPGRLARTTYAYLINGAAHHRNVRLYQAARDLRAHGCSQAEAEQRLVPRYVADAHPGENLMAREQEALRTVRSAYA